ncbi:PREDICTED: CD320 antigen [Chinchilla lanigera]|uniref:CD320 molecule n=1 Tax=Chinchilla lanigera TaxID=34839 RepID=A0A8C2URN7_CHILA|nr:PREDICTED: CD320 antigen [Chinchilla lanigera]XP_013364608.1 PREDICTED: CD320 antigen [Chinchilla lanigera]
MACGGTLLPAVLGLALRLLLGLGVGLEAAPTSAPSRTLAQPPGPRAGTCSPSSFQCRTSGFCVPLSWRCDGDADCGDGSDEEECRIQPCAQNGQCPPPPDPPCFCDSISDCPGGTDKNLQNCSHRQPCPTGQLPCRTGNTCVPHTWHCDGHPDCLDASDELGCEIKERVREGRASTVRTPVAVTLEGIASLRNSTASSVGDQRGNPNGYGVIAAAGLLGVSLAAVTLLVLFHLRAQGSLCPLGLRVAVKDSVALSERKSSVL